jgi:hypothetical protein
MTSWRESVPEPVQEHIDGLINVALDAASEFLDKSGEFFPFDLAVGEDGEISMFGVHPGLGEHPESTDVLRSLDDVPEASVSGFKPWRLRPMSRCRMEATLYGSNSSIARASCSRSSLRTGVEGSQGG